MYILTDSFLDDSFASFVHTAAAPESSQSTAVGRLLPEVMVADDYQVKYPSRMNYSNSYNLYSSTKAAQLPVVSPRCTADAEESFPQPSEKAETPEESTWCRKSLSEWSTDDVLRWVVSVGLVQFYDTFSKHFVIGHDISVISYNFLDRLQIYGQADRELVLSRLYLLHASTSNTGSQEVASSSCSTAESALMPTTIRACERERVDSDLMSDPTDDVPTAGIVKQLCFDDGSPEENSGNLVTIQVRCCSENDDEGSSECCHLSVSPSSTAAEVIRRLLDAKNVDDKEHLYNLVAVPTVGSEQFMGMC